MFPSLSIDTPGDFSSTSKAEVPTLVTEASTFTIVLSIFCSIRGFLAETVTPARFLATGISSIVFSVTFVFDGVISNTSEKPFVCPTAVIETKYLPSPTFSNKKLPSLLAALILATLESLAFNNVIVAASMVLVFPSITCPDTFPVVFWAWLEKDKAITAISMVRNFLILNGLRLLVLAFNYYSSKIGTC